MQVEQEIKYWHLNLDRIGWHYSKTGMLLHHQGRKDTTPKVENDHSVPKTWNSRNSVL